MRASPVRNYPSMRKVLWSQLVLLLLLVLTPFSWPRYDERILGFHCDITVSADGSMEVRETIKVRAAGNEIKRGIFREFPTRYQDRFGNPYRVGFEVREVKRDGRPDAWHTKDRENGVAVYIGSEHVLL